MDRENVIKGLELCEIGSGDRCYETECPYYGQGCTESLKNDILALLKEQNQQRWILCSDRFPKSEPDDLEYPTVIIALEDGTVELGCYYESTKEWGAGENFDRLRDPIAWMPLPAFHKESR